MKPGITLVLCCLLFSCSSLNDERGEDLRSNKAPLNIFDTIVPAINLDNDILINEFWLNTWLKKNYFNSYIVSEVKKVNSQNPDVEIYNVKVVGERPTSFHDTYTFLYLNSRKHLYLLPIEFNQWFNLDGQHMVGGIYSYREYDYYLIFKIGDTAVKLILDSRKIDGYGLKVGYYRDDDCRKYVPSQLNFQFNEQQKSIHFFGKILKFCTEGKDRDTANKTPVATDEVLIEFNYFNNAWQYNKNSKYRFW